MLRFLPSVWSTFHLPFKMLFAHIFEQLVSFRGAVLCLVCCLPFPFPGDSSEQDSLGCLHRLRYNRLLFLVGGSLLCLLKSNNSPSTVQITATTRPFHFLGWRRCFTWDLWVFIPSIQCLFYSCLSRPNSYLEPIHRMYSSSSSFVEYTPGLADVVEKWKRIFTVLCGYYNTS